MTVYLNGDYVDESKALIPVSDAGLLYGHGVYESLRTFNGSVRLFHEHFVRLSASAKALDIAFLMNESNLKKALEKLILLQGEISRDYRIRITLTAGNKDLRSNHPGKPTLIMTAKPLHATYKLPISMQSYKLTRQIPSVKTTAMLPAIVGQINAAKHGAVEALLTDENNIVHEGSFCNIYFIKDRILHYPKTGTLKGVTQALLLQLVADTIQTKETDLTLDDFYSADEVFSSGSVRGVVAVNSIDGHEYVAPGPLTLQIQNIYKTWAENL